MDHIDLFELGLLSDFIGQKWHDFLAFAEEHGLDEAQCEDLANKLDKAAGRS